jgi:peptidoglycan/xylan/chitin deacetylase (PgdA/CDA1 family)
MRGAYRKVRAVKNRLLNLVDPPVIILLYHRVADLPADPEMLAVSPENFRLHLTFLKQQFKVVRFEEDWTQLKKSAVAITFDDGYADNAVEALPIIEEVGVPVTFFVSTGNIGTDREFWWNRLEKILLQKGRFPASFRLDDSRFGRTWDSATLEQRHSMYNTLVALMQRVTPDRRESWLNQLEQWAGPVESGENFHRSMSHDEIKKLAASPWASIGAHTVTHSALSALTEEQQRKEIFTSKQELENMAELEITTFSYPFGRKQDYNNISVRLSQEAGFVKVASNFPGQVHRWTDPYQLPRHLVRNWDLSKFREEIESFWTR